MVSDLTVAEIVLDGDFDTLRDSRRQLIADGQTELLREFDGEYIEYLADKHRRLCNFLWVDSICSNFKLRKDIRDFIIKDVTYIVKTHNDIVNKRKGR